MSAWSKDAPIEPGWYWCMPVAFGCEPDDDMPSEPVRIYRPRDYDEPGDELVVACAGMTDARSLAALPNWRWGPRIPSAERLEALEALAQSVRAELSGAHGELHHFPVVDALKRLDAAGT